MAWTISFVLFCGNLKCYTLRYIYLDMHVRIVSSDDYGTIIAHSHALE